MNKSVETTPNVYTKNDMNNILFSGQKKKLSKIDKIIFCVFSLYTFGLLMLMMFVFPDALSEAFFCVGIVSMNAFAYTGYRWMSKSPFYVKREWKWFLVSCSIGALMPFVKFIGDVISQPYAALAIMPLLYLLFLTIREVVMLKTKKVRKIEKVMPLVTKFAIILLLLVIFIIASGFLKFNGGTIALLAIMIIGIGALITVQLLFLQKQVIKLFLSGIGSFIIIPLSTLVGVLLWSTVVFATKFDFGVVSFVGSGLQILILLVGVILMLWVKKEFEIPFVKSFISNIFLLFVGAIGVGTKSIDTSGSGSFINSWMLVIAATVFYGIIFIKDIKRSTKYQIIEGVTINILVFALLVITILQSMGTLNASRDIDVQTILTAVCLVPLFVNSIMSAIDWIRVLKFKEEEITWK